MKYYDIIDMLEYDEKQIEFKNKLCCVCVPKRCLLVPSTERIVVVQEHWPRAQIHNQCYMTRLLTLAHARQPFSKHMDSVKNTQDEHFRIRFLSCRRMVEGAMNSHIRHRRRRHQFLC